MGKQKTDNMGKETVEEASKQQVTGNLKMLHNNTVKLLLRCKKMCEAKV
jgi:hypothetical protein